MRSWNKVKLLLKVCKNISRDRTPSVGDAPCKIRFPRLDAGESSCHEGLDQYTCPCFSPVELEILKVGGGEAENVEFETEYSNTGYYLRVDIIPMSIISFFGLACPAVLISSQVEVY